MVSSLSAASRAWLLVAIAASALSPAVPARAATVPDLVAQADRLVDADVSVQALQDAAALYQQALQQDPGVAPIQIKLAWVALRIGDGVSGDPLPWFDLGEQAAGRALAQDEASADAHFLFAAHRGQIAKRRLASPAIVGELETHLLRALAIDPHHARAQHMMGVLLRDTPFLLRGYLKGSKSDVPRYLTGAVEADPNFAQARLDLAEYYRSAGRIADARAQAQAVLDMTHPTWPRPWREKQRPAAEAFLKTLPAR